MRTLALRCATALFLLTCLCLSTKAQIILYRQVVATSGTFGTTPKMMISYTVGEVAVQPITNGKLLLTQGFQQPEDFPKLPPGTNPLKSYILFPNPAVTNTKIQFDLLSNANITLELINPAGQTIYHQYLELGGGRNTVVLPVNHFAAGIYTVVINVSGQVSFEKLIVQ